MEETQQINQHQLDKLIENGYIFSPVGNIKRGFKIVATNGGLFIGFFIVFIVISFLSGLLDGLLFGALPPYLQINLVTTSVSAIILPGFYIASRKAGKFERLDFSDFFGGTKQAGKLLGVGLFLRLLQFLPMIPVMLSLIVNDNFFQALIDLQEAAQNGEPIEWPTISNITIILGIVGFLISLYFSVSYIFSVPLALFTTLSIWDSLETSRKVAARKFFPILGFLILQMLLILSAFSLAILGGLLQLVALMMLGFLVVFVIIYFVPVIICSNYAAFEEVFALETQEGETEITDHFVN